MRLAGSYSSILSKRFRNLRCSVPCDSRYSCNNTKKGGGGASFPARLVSPDSPVVAYTWLSGGARPWSSGSSPDAPGGSISAACDQRSRFITARFRSLGSARVLPAPLNHPARNRPPDSLHHRQVLLVVVSLQTETSETLTD